MENNTNQQFESPAEPPAKNKKVLKIILATIVIILLVVIGYFFLFLIPQPVVAPNQEVDSNATSKEDLENVDWQTYRNEEMGFEFSYPADYKVISDEVTFQNEYFTWYRIELEKVEDDQKVSIRFEVNADGYGPFFPHVGFELEEDENGRLIILDTYKYTSENQSNDRTLIIPDRIESRNGNSYSWIMSFDNGDKDFTEEFKNILQTFKFTN